MARVGFKKTFTQGTFDKLGIQTLFGHIKSTLVDAGFQVILDTADAMVRVLESRSFTTQAI